MYWHIPGFRQYLNSHSKGTRLKTSVRDCTYNYSIVDLLAVPHNQNSVLMGGCESHIAALLSKQNKVIYISFIIYQHSNSLLKYLANTLLKSDKQTIIIRFNA